MRCDCQCAHCRIALRAEPNDIPPALFARAIADASRIGCRRVAFTGGEALLHPAFRDLTDCVAGHGMEWNLVTNGSMPERCAAETVGRKGLGRVCVSLDGATAAVNDRIRGVGAFAKALATATLLKSKGVHVQITFTVNRLNIVEVTAVHALARTIGVDALCYGAVRPHIWNADVQLPWDMKAQAYLEVQSLKRSSPLRIWTATSLHSVMYPDKFCCDLTDPKPTLSPDGTVMFCCDCLSPAAAMGSLHEEGFESIAGKTRQTADALLARRRRCVEQKEFHEGFNSCEFCDRALETLRGQAGGSSAPAPPSAAREK